MIHSVFKEFTVDDLRDSRLPEGKRRSMTCKAGEYVVSDMSASAGVVLKKLGTADGGILISTPLFAELMRDGYITPLP